MQKLINKEEKMSYKINREKVVNRIIYIWINFYFYKKEIYIKKIKKDENPDKWMKSEQILPAYLLPGLTYCRLLVMAGNIVPFNSVGVEIVQNTKTDLSGQNKIKIIKYILNCIGLFLKITEKGYFLDILLLIIFYLKITDKRYFLDILLLIILYLKITDQGYDIFLIFYS